MQVNKYYFTILKYEVDIFCKNKKKCSFSIGQKIPFAILKRELDAPCKPKKLPIYSIVKQKLNLCNFER